MKISIVQYEIEAAIKAYILSQIAVNEDQDVAVKLSATRGPEGMTADIIVSKAGETNAVADTAQAVVQHQAQTAQGDGIKPAPLVPAKPLTFKRPTAGLGAISPGTPVAKPNPEPVAQTEAPVGEGLAATEEQLAAVEQAEDAQVEQVAEETTEVAAETTEEEGQTELVEEVPPAPPAGAPKRSLFKTK